MRQSPSTIVSLILHCSVEGLSEPVGLGHVAIKLSGAVTACAPMAKRTAAGEYRTCWSLAGTHVHERMFAAIVAMIVIMVTITIR